jgi:hypothetical protein
LTEFESTADIIYYAGHNNIKVNCTSTDHCVVVDDNLKCKGELVNIKIHPSDFISSSLEALEKLLKKLLVKFDNSDFDRARAE